MRVALRAEVVGSLSDLSVDDGDRVVKGQMVAQLESMKVMFPVYASTDGVFRLERELGEVVGEGEIVAWIVKD